VIKKELAASQLHQTLKFASVNKRGSAHRRMPVHVHGHHAECNQTRNGQRPVPPHTKAYDHSTRDGKTMHVCNHYQGSADWATSDNTWWGTVQRCARVFVWHCIARMFCILSCTVTTLELHLRSLCTATYRILSHPCCSLWGLSRHPLYGFALGHEIRSGTRGVCRSSEYCRTACVVHEARRVAEAAALVHHPSGWTSRAAQIFAAGLAFHLGCGQG
jgi:hypothetical protein